MKDKLIPKIKMKLGLCNYKGCCKRATAEICFTGIDTKRNVCDEHLLEFQMSDFIRSIKGDK